MTTDADVGGPGTTYELTVEGSLGPVLRLALTCGRVATIAPCTVVVVNDDRGRDLVDLVELLDAARVPVLSVLRLDGACATGRARTSPER